MTGRPAREDGGRWVVALVGGGVLLWTALYAPPLFFSLLWLVGLAGFLEGWRLLARTGRVIPWVALAAGLGATAAAGVTGRHASVAAFLLVVAALAVVPRGVGLLAPLYVGLFPVAIGATAHLYHHAPGYPSEPAAPALVVSLLLSVWAADVGAYVVGMRWGRTPLAPSISPAKTWEGVGGGLVLAALVGAVAAGPLAFAAWKGAAVGLVAGLAGPAGDLAESRLKRFTGVKDSSGILLGHGGVLDRFDAFAAAAAALALVRLAWRAAKILFGGSV